MKKSLRNQRNLLKVFCSLCFVLLFVNMSWGQQIIGSFPNMNGGFEGQVAGAIASGNSTTDWTKQSTALNSTISTTTPRTGTNKGLVTLSLTSGTRFLSSPSGPTTPVNMTVSTSYVMQMYVKNSTAIPSFQTGFSVNGTTDGNYSTAATLPMNSDWTKISYVKASGSAAISANGYGVPIRSFGTATIEIDDFVIYAGTAADATPPDAATSPTIPSAAATQQTISWTAPAVGAGNGVDGGGYMVVRSNTDPGTAPNTNGIYAVGNFVAGTEKVVYLGTATTFNDTGLSASTQYFYRIYSVDKAFNYSSAISVNGTTTAPSFAAEPTTQASAITFSSVTSTGMTINWTAGSGTNSLVVVKEGSAVDATPSDGSTLGPNLAFGSGALLGTGNYVVYNSTSNTAAITGLLKARTYYVKVYTFNGSSGSENYLLTSPPSNSQFTPPGEISSSGLGVSTSYSSTTAWSGGAVPTQYDNVTIVSGDIINLGSTQKCYNLTVYSGGTIKAATGQTLQIFGTSLACNGTFGDALTANSQLTLQFGGNLTISGSGLIYPYKVQPITLLSDIGVTFSANTEITYTSTAMLSDNTGNDNVTYTVTTGKTLTVDGNWNTGSSSSSNGNSNTTININSGATAILLKAFATPIASGKTCTVNVDGTLTGGSSYSPFSYTSGGTTTVNVNGTFTVANLNVTPIEAIVAPVINVGSLGSITVNGVADFSNTSVTGYIGNTTTGGTFILGALGTIKFATPGGLEPVSGPIRTSTRNFNSGANYNFNGAIAQVPGSDFPATVGNMTINNANGVTLSSSKTVSGILNLTSGTLSTGGNLTLGNGATIARIAGSLSAAPTFGSTVNVSYGGTLTTQTGTTISGNSSVTLSATNALITPGMPVSGTGIATGTTVSSILGTALVLSQNATAAGTVTLTFTYNTALETSNEIPTVASVLSNLTINHPAGVTLASATNLNNKLTVTSGVLTTAGLLTLKSAECCTAFVGKLAAGAVTGDVTVERYIPAKRAWRAITAPVIRATNNSIFTNWQNGGISGTSTGTGVEIWSNLSPLTTVTSNAGGGSSMLSYSSSGNSWSGITDTTNTPLFSSTLNNPFMVFVTGPYASTSTNITSGYVATTLKATGSLIIGTKTYATTGSQYTFIGNPYASPLSLTAMLTDPLNSTNFTNGIWIWDSNGNTSVGSYNYFDKTAGTYSYNASSTPAATPILPTAEIQSGQAFFVQQSNSTATGVSFSITEDHKGISVINTVLRDAAPAQLLRVGLYKQSNTEWSGRDGAMTVILNDADANQMANKMANGTENVAFTKNSGLFASNHHLPLVASDVLNVKVWNTTAGANYKLKINTEQFATTSLNAILEDLFTNSRTPLTLNGSAVEYPFAVTTEATSTGNRFRIVFENSALGINNPKATGISILPNPITGDTFQVNFGTLGMGSYSYSICNALGQEVEKGSINNVAQNTNSVVKFKNNTAAGMYIMKVTGSDNSVFTAKIIKK